MMSSRWETIWNLSLLVTVTIIPPGVWWVFTSSFQQRFRLIGTLVVVGITLAGYSQIYRVEIGTRHAADFDLIGKFTIANQLTTEYLYHLFRLGAQNKAITYILTVSGVIAVGLLLGLPGENQTFAFIYATLLFFQVLISQQQHLLAIGPVRTLTESDYEEADLDPTSNQEMLKIILKNIGTDTANNIRLYHRLYAPNGRPVGTRQLVDLDKEARSLEAGDQTDPLDVLITYEIPESLQGDHYLHHIVAQTGEGISLLSNTTWRERES